MVSNKTQEVKSLSENTVEIDSLNRQVRTLNDQIKRLTGENEGLFNEVRDGQEKVRLSNNQISKMAAELDTIRIQNEDLSRKTLVVGETSSKLIEYENKNAQMAQEIERLTAIIEKKNN